jgi:hypothetical protein
MIVLNYSVFKMIATWEKSPCYYSSISMTPSYYFFLFFFLNDPSNIPGWITPFPFLCL